MEETARHAIHKTRVHSQPPHSARGLYALCRGSIAKTAGRTPCRVPIAPLNQVEGKPPAMLKAGDVLFIIDRPAILRALGGEDSALRGGNRGQPFKLISPTRTVIVSARPTFKWDTVLGATAYTVYVNDASGQIVARSDELTPDRREWLVPKPLKRGEIYAWTVTALVDGKEIVSPGPSAPEMKFQVLSAPHLAQLSQLRRAGSHLALGVFYARAGMITETQHEFEIW